MPNFSKRHVARSKLTTWAFVLAILMVSGVVISQSIGPTESTKATNKLLATIDIASEIPDIAGRQLRARTVMVEPGGKLAVHSHKGRPTLEYVVQGSIVEIRNGVEVPHVQGDLIVGSQEVTHWWENRSSAVAVLLPVDIFKP